jgi:hypothetical protein
MIGVAVGCCAGCSTLTDSGLILYGLAEEIAVMASRLQEESDPIGQSDVILEYFSDSFGFEYGKVLDAPIRFMVHACRDCAERAGMRTELLLPGADLADVRPLRNGRYLALRGTE